MTNLFVLTYQCLMQTDPGRKQELVNSLVQLWPLDKLSIDPQFLKKNYAEAGRPENPTLVSPANLPRRKVTTTEGHAALIHSIVHIEFTAINLALDAIFRFQTMPRAYYADWIQVAGEEAYHFGILDEHLRSLGFEYGDFVAHNGLWQMAEDTKNDIVARMMMVSRVLEARGLDVTPGIMQRLEAIGDQRAADLLKIIFRDEIGHVKIGTRWFHYCCDQVGKPRQETFESLLKQYQKGPIKLPLQRDARKSAGFSETELNYLEGFSE